MSSSLEYDLSRGEEAVNVLGELHYCGFIDHWVFVNFLQMSFTDNIYFQELLDCYQVYARAFHITVELMQNVNRHGARLGTEKVRNYSGIQCVEQQVNPQPCWIAYHLLVTEEEVIIRCSNFVVESMCTKLEAKLGNSSCRTPEEKRMLYMTQLSNGSLSERGGAGLGLIDVARKRSDFLWWFTHHAGDRRIFRVESRHNRVELKRRQELFRSRFRKNQEA